MASMRTTSEFSVRVWRRRTTALLSLAAIAAVIYACGQPPPAKPPEPPAPPEPPSACPEQPNPAAFEPACVIWAQAQESFAALALEALKLGRIDAGVYSLDPATRMLRVTPPLVRAEPGRASPLSQALSKVNANPVSRALLEAAYRTTTSPENLAKCPAKSYPVKVTRDDKTDPGIEMYHWDFAGPEKPSDEQLSTCFQALYGAAPAGCPVLPSLFVPGKCAQLTGLYPQQLQATLPESSLAEENSAASNYSASNAPRALRSGRCPSCGCCGQVGRYWGSGPCGSC